MDLRRLRAQHGAQSYAKHEAEPAQPGCLVHVVPLQGIVLKTSSRLSGISRLEWNITGLGMGRSARWRQPPWRYFESVSKLDQEKTHGGTRNPWWQENEAEAISYLAAV